MQPEAPMPEGQAPAPAPKGGEQNPMEVISGLGDSLMALNTAVSESGGALPPEAVDHLQRSVNEFQQFMQVAGGGEAAEAPEAPKGAMGNAPADTAGRKGAVPADMAQMRKGAVPA